MKDYRNRIDLIDDSIQKLFIERMELVKEIAKYKKANGLNVLDSKREEEIIEKNLSKINNPDLKEYYKELFLKMLEISKTYQERILDE